MIKFFSSLTVNEGVFIFEGDKPINSLPLFFKETVFDTTVETFNSSIKNISLKKIRNMGLSTKMKKHCGDEEEFYHCLQYWTWQYLRFCDENSKLKFGGKRSNTWLQLLRGYQLFFENKWSKKKWRWNYKSIFSDYAQYYRPLKNEDQLIIQNYLKNDHN